ncbi:MAG: S-layer protein, partial [Planctomycetaceae bacterium]
MTRSLLALLLLAGAGGINADAAEPRFDLDVVPVLSKLGCNSGGCHGALAGKGGFRLSLFGYDPAADHGAITREALGRRVDPADPGASLLLAKPSGAVP